MPRAIDARLTALRIIEVSLPTHDLAGKRLIGLDQVRVLYLPLGVSRPSSEEVLNKGEVILERRRPDLPGPGASFRLDLQKFQRPAGWLVLVAVRLGNVVGEPSEVLPWLNPQLDLKP